MQPNIDAALNSGGMWVLVLVVGLVFILCCGFCCWFGFSFSVWWTTLAGFPTCSGKPFHFPETLLYCTAIIVVFNSFWNGALL